MQGLEAKHQPIKRAKKGHCNGKSFTRLQEPSARGFVTVHATTTDIIQVTKRMTVRDVVCCIVPSEKGRKMRVRSELHSDPLSAVIHQIQQDYLAELGISEEN